MHNAYIRLLKPAHWVKNLLVALPLLMSGNFASAHIAAVLAGILSFSFLSSAVYILNDILILSMTECTTVSTSGHWQQLLCRLKSTRTGLFLIAVVFIFHVVMGLSVWLLLIYLLLNYFYSIAGKRIRFVDILLLSSFYLIRVIYGGEIAGVTLTGWFMATITMAVLAISVHKRYMECMNTVYDEVPGRGYTKSDTVLLRHVMFNFSTMVQVLLNIHAYFVLGISEFYFYCLMNLITAGIILFYFDDSKNASDDPVARILGIENYWSWYSCSWYFILTK